jgi:hypothetical protein
LAGGRIQGGQDRTFGHFQPLADLVLSRNCLLRPAGEVI